MAEEHRRTRGVPLKIFAFAAAAALFAHADPAHADEAPGFDKSPRASVLGLSLAYQAPHNLDKEFTGGFGITYTHEYFVTRRTSLGINAAPRFFPAAPWHFALGYGLIIKHYIGNWGATKSSGLYLSYGLLLQMNWLKDVSGVAVGHDTKLAFGFDWTSKKLSPVIEAGYHLTQVRSFDRDTIWWPYTEVMVGIRF